MLKQKELFEACLPSFPPFSVTSSSSLFSSPTVCLLRALYSLALVVSDLVAFLSVSTTLSPLWYPSPPALEVSPETPHPTVLPRQSMGSHFSSEGNCPSSLCLSPNHHNHQPKQRTIHPFLTFLSTFSHPPLSMHLIAVYVCLCLTIPNKNCQDEHLR